MSETRPSDATVEVAFTVQQIELVDRVAVEWGVSREATVERILSEELARARVDEEP